MDKVFAWDLRKVGGGWLAQARTYLQWNVPFGEFLTWGSLEPVNISVKQIEELASEVAANAINQERHDQQMKLKNLVQDCPIGYNGEKLIMGRWSSEKDVIEWIGKLQQMAGIE
jgi:hypothetical protein